MDSITLSLFNQRLAAVCEEMGVCLCRSAFSPNIRDRLDYSCAVFDPDGRLAAQAAHIPVHLGSMAYALERLIHRFEWREGDMLVFNDPAYGGTHLPDVTVVSPLFLSDTLIGFAANRAHHADIGASTPGGMPLSCSLDEEGPLITPRYLVRAGEIQWDVIEGIVSHSLNPVDERGDYLAQIASNNIASDRLTQLAESIGIVGYREVLTEINRYGERLARAFLNELPHGRWEFTDYMDDDGVGTADIPIKVTLEITDTNIRVDFSGTSGRVAGNINCPSSVTTAAVSYVFRSFLPEYTPACHGVFAWLDIHIPENCLLGATGKAAIAGGNVETSSRIVDCLLGAFAQVRSDYAVAASQGTMNNLAMGASGDPAWAYYETIGGGCGASAAAPGLSATQSHMTNTLNTPIEVLEMKYPLRMHCYAVRWGSGGDGLHCGGDGIVREYEFLKPAICSLLSERRRRAPWGIAGGADGACGINLLNGRQIRGKLALNADLGDRLTIMTPGGGGWGRSV